MIRFPFQSGLLGAFLGSLQCFAGLWNSAAGAASADLGLPLARRARGSPPGTARRFRAADEDRAGLPGLVCWEFWLRKAGIL